MELRPSTGICIEASVLIQIPALRFFCCCSDVHNMAQFMN